MRYAVLSRFQGTLLAAALGEALGAYGRSQPSIPQTGAFRQTAWLASWHPGLQTDVLSRTPSGGRIAISYARALVEAGGWSERNLAAIGVQLATSKAATLEGSGTIAAELAIATLPIALFFHDDARRQQQRLLQTVKGYCPPGAEAGLLAVGYAIAQALQERLHPQTLLPQTIAYLKIAYPKQSTANRTTPLLEFIGTLEETQALVQHRAGLHAALDRLQMKGNDAGNSAIALAFYCFLSTPDDLRLSLLRAARCGELAPIICALTGAFSGAHQSISGLPLAWQFVDASLLPWGITHAALRQLATHLFAAWSGVYAPTMGINDAIAAPGVIRPR